MEVLILWSTYFVLSKSCLVTTFMVVQWSLKSLRVLENAGKGLEYSDDTGGRFLVIGVTIQVELPVSISL